MGARKKNKFIWEQVDLLEPRAQKVPREPGVYVIADVNRLFDLILETEVLYIGKAKNLRRRFVEHTDPWREHNKGLMRIPFGQKLEFWFSRIPEDKIGELEKTLIREIKPRENIIRYGGEND